MSIDAFISNLINLNQILIVPYAPVDWFKQNLFNYTFFQHTDFLIFRDFDVPTFGDEN